MEFSFCKMSMGSTFIMSAVHFYTNTKPESIYSGISFFTFSFVDKIEQTTEWARPRELVTNGARLPEGRTERILSPGLLCLRRAGKIKANHTGNGQGVRVCAGGLG